MNRWSLVSVLLTDTSRESRRLAHALSLWPFESRKHLILDEQRGRPAEADAEEEGKRSVALPAETAPILTHRFFTPPPNQSKRTDA